MGCSITTEIKSYNASSCTINPGVGHGPVVNYMKIIVTYITYTHAVDMNFEAAKVYEKGERL